MQPEVRKRANAYGRSIPLSEICGVWSGKERWCLRRGRGRIIAGAGQNMGGASDAVTAVFGNDRTAGDRRNNESKTCGDTAGLTISHHIMVFVMLVRCGTVFRDADRNNAAVRHCFIADENRIGCCAALGCHLQQRRTDINRLMGKRQHNKCQYA